MKTADIVLMQLIKKNIAQTSSIFLPNFHMKYPNQSWSEVDLFQLTENDWTVEYEIKISKSDLRKDFDKVIWFNHYACKKHDVMLSGDRCNRFYFVIPKIFVQDKNIMGIIPEKYGIITYDFEQKQKRNIFQYYRKAKILHKDKTVYRKFVIDTALSKYNYLYIKYINSQIKLMRNKC